MIIRDFWLTTRLATVFSILLLTACNNTSNSADSFTGLKAKVLVGSALGDFCNQAAKNFNATQPKLDNGTAFQASCEAQGSGDIVTKLVSLATQLKNGTLQADAADFPTIISLDGDIYYSQLVYRINQVYPGQNYIPQITDSELLASTPMVFMAQTDVAEGLRKVADPYKALVTAKTHRDIDASGPPTVVHYVHAAPTRSNSGLQTLVAQYASVSGKRPEELTIADIQKFQPQIQQIQSKITRYGVSTNSLAQAMVKNGPFWASVGSVYESSVIAANSGLQPGQERYEAVYPKVTFTSNMRAILPKAPWVSADEKAAAEKFITYLRSPQTQKIATDLGLRPGTPGVALGPKFTSEFGVNSQAKYDSLRPPKPEVVEAMLKSWQEVAKKPSLVVVVVDSSGSMSGNKLPAVQNTLQNYVKNLGPKEQIALIDFDSAIRSPVLVDGTPQGRDRGLQFVSSLNAEGGTKLYDAALYARNWLQKNLRKDAINAVLILTDGEDSESQINLNQLSEELKKSGFSTDQRIGFFTVGYGKEGEFDPKALKTIAELNGGYYSKGDPETISRLMADLQVEF
ncbi:VWA domain-containing protein [Nostocaceae cyanobacterium CENA369]|uniref:VWA domain-containing protein n=1 Tax=Dendronalium phyllosphericum CENA369 TaxID=1725256 RepID=A0A8J7I222_9NOST|nr:VWA domain-containing protein [Dendronalium phyllosphericum]MBH8574635.1 VWA domain-containing protein [Dendronalium phyllosphericum CENA369]